ncbi:MAG: efflux RND transporter permease subunit [Candidatus Hydrogenedentes bacterium]|nr:efflux RND transporter permease subunit [Candidatus Hydrogenedentota bacterium]
MATGKDYKRHRIIHWYSNFLRLALRWRAVTVTLAVTVLVVIGAIYFAKVRVEFMPSTEPFEANIDLECAEGTSLDSSDQIARQVEEMVWPYKDDVEFIMANVGSQGISRFGNSGGGSSHLSRINLDFLKLAESRIKPSQILKDVRPKLREITGADVRIEREEMGPPTGPPINVEISGDDFETLAQLAQQIRAEIKNIQDLVDLRDDYDKGKPEVRVKVDRQQAWLTGLNTEFIGLTVKAAVNGRKAADYREGDEEYDVTVRFPRAFREDLSNIEAMNLINLSGHAIPFSAVAKLEQGAGLGSITHINRKRTVTVAADVENDPDRPATKVLADVQERLRQFPLPAGYTLAYTGENEDQQETQSFLSKAFAIALLLVTLVMVAQFNSIIQPLIIMATVILSLTGVFLGLVIFDMPFGILMTGIACISLAGVVVNNGIVLVDFINQRVASGKPVEEAIVEAGTTRFRPVMLTAVTTVLGLIPMVFGVSFDFFNLEWVVGGETSQFWGPMAIAVSFGLGFATILTLIVVPTLYSFTHSIVSFFKKPPVPA